MVKSLCLSTGKGIFWLTRLKLLQSLLAIVKNNWTFPNDQLSCSSIRAIAREINKQVVLEVIYMPEYSRLIEINSPI